MAWQLYVLEFPNGKRYFGVTSRGLKVRLNGHCYSASQGRPKLPVHLAIRKYGRDSVIARTLVIGERDYILDLEVKEIKAFNTTDRCFGYNISIGGDTVMTGRRHSEESREKNRIAHTGKTLSPEAREKLRLFNTGRKLSPEACAKIGDRHRGKKITVDQREHLRLVNIGKKWTEAQRIKLTGRECSPKKIGRAHV